jgi:predicted secreted protein
LNTHNFLDPQDQQFIAVSYIRVFLDTTLGIDNTYEELLSNVDAFRNVLPDTVYITNYEDSNFEQLFTFDGTVDIGAQQSVEVSGTDTWTISAYSRGDNGEGENYVLSVEWEEESAPEISMNFDAVDISNGYISFALADMNEMEVESIENGFNYTVTLTDINGNTVTVDNPTFIYHTLAVQLWKDDVFFGSYEYKHQMQRVVITQELFAQAAGFDFTAVTGITVTTDGTEAGALIIDNVGYWA